MSVDDKVQLRYEDREGGGVAFVTLNREAKLNALDSDLMEQFANVFEQLAHRELLRCVVVTGAGDRAFAAGADVEELASIMFPTEAGGFINRVHACCEAVRSISVPVIARINGHALGAGLELAISCDLRVAADAATFGMPEVRLGIPSVVEAALLPGLIGWGRAREMLLLGDSYDAHTALEMGLVEEVVPADTLNAAVERRIASVMANGRNALRLQKALLRRWETMPIRDAILAGVDVFGQAFQTDEPGIAMRAWSTTSAIKPRPPKPPAPPARAKTSRAASGKKPTAKKATARRAGEG
ncbi:MAG TPA: enoyl-CoA hydratase [Caulobacteraceae bacterium]